MLKQGITWLLITVSSKLADVMSLEDIKGGGFKLTPPLTPLVEATEAPLDDAKDDDPPTDDDDDEIPPVVFNDELFVAAKGCSASVLDLILLKIR